ncbi:MAG: alanine racemase [Kiritimatiellia bacterium]
MERNLSRMAALCHGRHAKLRPHFKSHKCTRIARLQLEAGNCCGITCALVSEAEVLVEAGVRDILIANQVLGRGKLQRLAQLNRRADVKCCVDSPLQVEALAAAARTTGVEIGVLVEINVGLNRAGVDTAEEAIQLARLVEQTPGLQFRGLQAYEGHACFVEDATRRKQIVDEALGKIFAFRSALEAGGIPVPIVSAGGTGTYDLTGAAQCVDELQVGSYALMDAHYRRIKPEFENSLFLWSTVLSVQGDRTVFDVGYKSCGAELGPPHIQGLVEQPRIFKLNEEHFCARGVGGRFAVGEKIRLVPWHGCTTATV